MSNTGPSVSDSVKRLQEHALDYGLKCRNACYSGIVANWALLVTNNVHSLSFVLSTGCLLAALALDISISKKGMQLLINRIKEAQETGDTKIRFSADEAVVFAQTAEKVSNLVYAGLVIIALGFVANVFIKS